MTHLTLLLAGAIDEYHRIAAFPDRRLRLAKLGELVSFAERAYACRGGRHCVLPVYPGYAGRWAEVPPADTVDVRSPAGGVLSLWRSDPAASGDYAGRPSFTIVHANKLSYLDTDSRLAGGYDGGGVYTEVTPLNTPAVLEAHHHALPDLFVAAEAFFLARELT